MTKPYNEMTKQEFAKHIEENYHAGLRENIPRTSELLYTVPQQTRQRIPCAV